MGRDRCVDRSMCRVHICHVDSTGMAYLYVSKAGIRHLYRFAPSPLIPPLLSPSHMMCGKICQNISDIVEERIYELGSTHRSGVLEQLVRLFPFVVSSIYIPGSSSVDPSLNDEYYRLMDPNTMSLLLYPTG